MKIRLLSFAFPNRAFSMGCERKKKKIFSLRPPGPGVLPGAPPIRRIGNNIALISDYRKLFRQILFATPRLLVVQTVSKPTKDGLRNVDKTARPGETLLLSEPPQYYGITGY
jgi:hypothetical protein